MNSPRKIPSTPAVPGTGTPESKAVLRREMRRLRAELSADERDAASGTICDAVWNWLIEEHLPITPGESLGVYLAGPHEPNLDGLIQRLLDRDVSLAAPRVDLEQGSMAFWALDNLESVQSGPWGVRQPPAQRRIEQIQWVLVPALAYDMQGGRLGTGGGWYDRALPHIPRAAGICFDFQRVPQVPQEGHDCRVQALFTEKGHWEFVS